MDSQSSPDEPAADGAPARNARRALLRRLAYTLPAVLGTFVVARDAAAQASCLPACQDPNSTHCGPDCCLPQFNCPPWFCSPVQSCNPFS